MVMIHDPRAAPLQNVHFGLTSNLGQGGIVIEPQRLLILYPHSIRQSRVARRVRVYQAGSQNTENRTHDIHV